MTQLIDPKEGELRQAMITFAGDSARAEVAVIYTTGHGTESEGLPRILLPYSRADGSSALTVSELAHAAQAKRVNLVFYAACRNRYP